MTEKQRDAIFWKYEGSNKTIQDLISQPKMMSAVNAARASQIIQSEDEDRVERYLKAVWKKC